MFYFYGSVQLERHENKLRGTANGTGRKKSYGCDLEKEIRKKNWICHILRGESLLKEVIKGRIIGKSPRGRKRFGLGMLNEFVKKSSYAKLKRKAENRKEWRIWKPRTCLTAEH